MRPMGASDMIEMNYINLINHGDKPASEHQVNQGGSRENDCICPDKRGVFVFWHVH